MRSSSNRGFGLIVYAVLALAILGTLAGIGYSIRKAGADAVRAELQPKLDTCQQLADGLAKQLKAQNDAVAALQAEGAKKAKAASQALAKAEGKAKVWEDNAVRLQVVLTARKPDGPKTCAEAWQEIRK